MCAFEVIPQQVQLLASSRTPQPLLQLIERAGRTCYKSEHKIGCIHDRTALGPCSREAMHGCAGCPDHSSNKFVLACLQRGHWAMVEFADVYIHVDMYPSASQGRAVHLTPHVRYYSSSHKGVVIVGNLRALLEFANSDSQDMLRSAVSTALGLEFGTLSPWLRRKPVPDLAHGVRVVNYETACAWGMPIEETSMTFLLVTNRGVTHEIVRHRPCSFAQESTRYVNYAGGRIKFIKPVWASDRVLGVFDKEGERLRMDDVSTREGVWLASLAASANAYDMLMQPEGFADSHWRAEQAREVLPNALKTEIVVKANYAEWKHIFNLRSLGLTGRPHPQMKDLADRMVELACAHDPYWTRALGLADEDTRS